MHVKRTGFAATSADWLALIVWPLQAIHELDHTARTAVISLGNDADHICGAHGAQADLFPRTWRKISGSTLR